MRHLGKGVGGGRLEHLIGVLGFRGEFLYLVLLSLDSALRNLELLPVPLDCLLGYDEGTRHDVFGRFFRIGDNVASGLPDCREDFRGYPLAECLCLRLAAVEDDVIQAVLIDKQRLLNASRSLKGVI